MPYTVSITSQGQVTIPKPIRDKYGIKSGSQALVEDQDNCFKITPYTDNDFFSLFGIGKNNPRVKANKGKPLQKVIEEETKAFHQGIVDSYLKSINKK